MTPMAASQPPAHEVEDEQSMEEILQSIRRIIAEEDEQQKNSTPSDGSDSSKDDEDVLELTEIFEAPELQDTQSGGAAHDPLATIDAFMAESSAAIAQHKEAAAAAAAVQQAQAEADEVFGYEEDAAEDLAPVVQTPAQPQPFVPPVVSAPEIDDQDIPAAPREQYESLDSLISDEVAHMATNHLKDIRKTAKAAYTQPKLPPLTFRSGTTVEDLMLEALRPMLKEWLDQHLAHTVERIVAREINRLVEHVEEE